MKDIKVIWRDRKLRVYVASYEHVHSFGVVEYEGKPCLRIYIDDAFGGETATFELDEILFVKL